MPKRPPTVPLCHVVCVGQNFTGFGGESYYVAENCCDDVDPNTGQVPDVSTYYTSILYPILIEEAMRGPVPVSSSGQLLTIPLDDMTGPIPFMLPGTLEDSIRLVSYTNQRDVNPETMTGPIPVILASTLIPTIVLVNYFNQRDVNPDTMTGPIPVFLTSTLIVTVNYIDYFNQRDVAPDTMTGPIPVLLSGTLV